MSKLRIAGVMLAVVAVTATHAHAYTVLTASHDVEVDCGTGGTDVPTDWYFPQPNDALGLVWLQHGFSRANNQMIDLATKIAERGFVVFAPSMAPGTSGCAMNNAGFLQDFSRLFSALDDPNQGLLQAARAAATAAGTSITFLPPTFVFAGHSAGGAAAVYVAKHLVTTQPITAAALRGLSLLDPVESISGSLIGSSLSALTGVRLYTVSSPPYSCNSNANGTALLAALPRPFVGVELTSGCHCDAEGASTDALCTLFCGTPQAANVSILQTLTTRWIGDLFAGSYTPDYYPGGGYYGAQLAINRIRTLPAPSSCGNGTVNAGEQCDDGNQVNGDCCNGVCQREPAGRPCPGDGNLCTDDVCSAAGQCGVANSSPCNDGLFCNGADTCSGGTCSQHAGNPCSSGLECARVCVEASDACRDPAGTACSNDGNPCSADMCDGLGVCQHPAGNAGAPCRAAAGPCDTPEACSGTSSTCPNDSFLPAATACRSAAGVCDVAESCTGTSALCPLDGFAGSTTICRAAAGDCDLAETCSGSGPTCPSDTKKSAGSACPPDTNVCTLDRCDGSSSVCQHPPGNAGTLCRAASGECDTAEVCNGTTTTCPTDAVAGAGVACGDDGNPCTRDVCDGSSSICTHDAGNTGTVCRPSADPCDTAEACDGVNTVCPSDSGLPDGDVDGVCDAQDNCPTSANAAQEDGDGDLTGDLCDPCTGPAAFAEPQLALQSIDAIPGNDRLKFKATVALPFPFDPALDPEANGVRILLTDAGGTVLDVAIAPGVYDSVTRSGWKRNGSGTRWTYLSRVGIAGIRKVVIAQVAGAPGQLKVKVSGKLGTFAPAVLPPVLTVVFDPPSAMTGQCGEATFPGPSPKCYVAASTIICR